MAKRESIYTKDVILVMIASFCFMFSNMYCNPLINGYAQKLGASSTFAGVIAGMMSLVAMFLRPIAGNLTDRISKYRLASWGGVRFVYRLHDDLAGQLGPIVACWGGDGTVWNHECTGNGVCTGSLH